MEVRVEAQAPVAERGRGEGVHGAGLGCSLSSSWEESWHPLSHWEASLAWGGEWPRLEGGGEVEGHAAA